MEQNIPVWFSGLLEVGPRRTMPLVPPPRETTFPLQVSAGPGWVVVWLSGPFILLSQEGIVTPLDSPAQLSA